MSAPSTPELQNGPGTGPRPSSSKSTAASVSVLSLPPCSAGTRMPGQPTSTALRHSAGTRRAVLERDLVEVEEGAIRLRHQLAHPLELRPHIEAVELHRRVS